MADIEHHATNVIENATVEVAVGDPHTIEADYVEYCVSSDYVKAVDDDANTTITSATSRSGPVTTPYNGSS